MNGKSYWKTAKIGRGGSSEVFRVVSSEGEVRITVYSCLLGFRPFAK